MAIARRAGSKQATRLLMQKCGRNRRGGRDGGKAFQCPGRALYAEAGTIDKNGAGT
jgi:hypothetical protein